MSTIIQADAVEEGMELAHQGGSVLVDHVEVKGIRVNVITACGQRLVARANARVQVLS